jgi:predicted alpha/beta hydrolase
LDAGALDDVFADDIMIPAVDGYPLAATLFLPRGPKRHAVLINSATATPRKIYRGFASYLAHRGCAVLTYDYRGIGGSRKAAVEGQPQGQGQPQSLQGFEATLADWALLDMTAAVGWMRERYCAMPLRYVGHSFGGQALGLLPNNTDVSRALFIAAQAGNWRLMSGVEGYRVAALLNGIGVPLTRALGYAPGWAGIGEDLPKGVFLQWVRWVMSPHYLFDDASLPSRANFANFTGALRALHLSDDPWATRPAVELLCAGFPSVTPEVLSVTPKDIGATRIGHFGFFRPNHRDTLWRSAADWLLEE